MKAERNISEFETCTKYVVDARILQRDLDQCHSRVNQYKLQNEDIAKENMELKQVIKELNETYQSVLNSTASVTLSSTKQLSASSSAPASVVRTSTQLPEYLILSF